ncbi:MAG: HIT domain-containing protein, partial [Candidatus Omnitrophota bacterium]
AHIMVAPFRHVKTLEQLSDKELLDLMTLVKRTKIKLDKKMKPDGYNIGINMGKIAGAGFAGHLHIHIVPRWYGDTNFMPVLANTKVVSDSLKAAYDLLKGR